MEDYSVIEVCDHDVAYLKVLESVATCETTQLTCADCGEALEEPKIDC